MPAPVASGGSESPGGACTHWKAPPCHGARGKRSFDDFVDAGEDRSRDRQSQGLRSLQIDNKIKLYRLLDGQFSGPGSLDYTIDVVRCPPKVVRDTRPVRHQTAVVRELPLGVHRGDARHAN